MSTRWTPIFAAAAAALWPALGDAECRAVSPPHTVALIELYTSEGCDSCPPADRWFSSLNLGAADGRAIGIAFHVDYWDRLGWRDRFGSAAYTARQYEQMTRRRAAFVYTPQVLLQGGEFGGWRNGSGPGAALASINARPSRATIELAAASVARNTEAVDVHVSVPQGSDRAHAALAVAVIQDGLASDVKAGENAGKRLVHDHVVRAWSEGTPIGPSGELRRHFDLELPAEQGPVQVVAFVEDTATGEVLQATALRACSK